MNKTMMTAAMMLGLMLSACKGETGPTGPAGDDGDAGARGVVGVAGPTGATGATGAQGNAGAQGEPGPAGPAGPVGPQGVTGATGPTGPQGITGAAGATGATGPAGAPGAPGLAGVAGPPGAFPGKAAVYEVTSAPTFLPPSTVGSGFGGTLASCAAPGDMLLTGTCTVDPQAHITGSRIYNAGDPASTASWLCQAYNGLNAANAVTVTARAYCLAQP